MCNNFEISNQLPSPPLSPSNTCNKMEVELSINTFEGQGLKQLKIEKPELRSPIELINSNITDKEEIYQKKFLDFIYNGVAINSEEVIPYEYFIEKLHKIGGTILNKKTNDSVLLKVYEINDNKVEGEKGEEEEEEECQSYYVHPVYLSLQSYQLFKLFEDINSEEEEEENNSEEKEQNQVIEIEVPSLKTFPNILYYLYTGDVNSLVEIAKKDESIYKSMVENIKYFNLEQIFSFF